MALFLLGGLVAAATILAGVYALCIRFRYRRLSKSESISTEKLITSTEVSISADYEGRQRGSLLDKEDNEQSKIDAERKELKAEVGRDQPRVAAREVKVGKDESESIESSEIGGDQESKPLLAGSGPKEAAKYGASDEVNAQFSVPNHSDLLPTKEKQGGVVDATLLEIEKQKTKPLETSTAKDDVAEDINAQLLPIATETSEPQKGKDEPSDVSETKKLKSEPLETSSALATKDDPAEDINAKLLPIETNELPLKKGKDEPADVSEVEEQASEPLIKVSTAQAAKDGVTDTLLLPLSQTSELQEEKSGSMDTSVKAEMGKSTPTVKTSSSPANNKESIADKLNALFQPKLQKEMEDLHENTQTFPPMTKSPLPHVAPRPAPKKSRPSDSASPRPVSSATPRAPPVAAKPAVQARKQVYSPSAVPVLPMAFGKGGFTPPALRRKTEVSNSEDRQSPQMAGRLQMGTMFNGGFGVRGSGHGGSEIPSSFDEV